MVTAIEIRAPDGSLQSMVVTDTVVIGREGDVIVADPALGRRHAMIGPGRPGSLVLTDLGSVNGCLVNGRRVEDSATLRHGDQLVLGNTVVVVSAVTGSAPLQADRVKPASPRVGLPPTEE
jgi:pSer/pThr/pTyr-binding forkhead associated (FHA) protein